MDNDNQYGTLEVQKYYMKPLKDFHEYCIAHGIQYSLNGGSLLGAIRHKGFIPWDDDVDVMFDRHNYDLFLSTFHQYPMEGYEIIGYTWVKRLTPENNPMKEKEERCIDLFVFDNVPKNKVQAFLKHSTLKILQGMMKKKPEYERFSWKYKILLFTTWSFGRLFPQPLKRRWYSAVSQWGKESGKVNIYNSLFSQISRVQYDRSMLDGYVPVEFEGEQFMALEKWHEYLSTIFGDYMTPPKAEERKPMHSK